METGSLPTDLPGLDVLMRTMPMFGAMVAGQQTARAQENNQSLQDAFKTQQEYLQKERPLTLNEIVARTGQHTAQAGMLNQQATGQGLANDLTRATQPGQIAYTNATNTQKTTEAQAGNKEAEGQLYGQLAAQLKGTLPMMRPALVRQVMGDRMKDHPELEPFLTEHADNLPDYFAAMSDESFKASKAAKAEAQKLAGQQKVAETHVQGQKDVAVINERKAATVAATQVAGKLQAVHDAAEADWSKRGAELMRRADLLPPGPAKDDLKRQADMANQTALAFREANARANNEKALAISDLIGEAKPPQTVLPSFGGGASPRPAAAPASAASQAAPAASGVKDSSGKPVIYNGKPVQYQIRDGQEGRDDYAAIPSNSVFMDMQGNIRTKP